MDIDYKNNLFSGDSDIPDEILTMICAYLSAEEIASLQYVSQEMRHAIKSETMKELLLQPLFNRLHQLDPSISGIPSINLNFNFNSNVNINILNAIRAGFNKINQDQIKEIVYLEGMHSELYVDDDMKGPAITIDMLEKRNRRLDEWNTLFICQEIILGNIELHLSFVGITRFPDKIMQDPNLQDYWKKLKKLACDNNCLSVLPVSIIQLKNLQELSCHHNKITNLPPLIGKLENIEKLDCSHNKIVNFPDSIGDLKKMRWLVCNDNQLSILPLTIGKLKNLHAFDCFNNQLIALPETIGELRELEGLYCHHNKITFLPKTIGNLRQLQCLDCSYNQLDDFPEGIGDLLNLQCLEFSNNNIVILPDLIKNLIHLQWLDCSHNQLVSLPPSIGNFLNLEYLDCSENNLIFLPDTIINLINLDVLACDDKSLADFYSGIQYGLMGSPFSLPQFFAFKKKKIANKEIDDCDIEYKKRKPGS